jgi:hypothetical protein
MSAIESPTNIHCWPKLPDELKLEVLEYVVKEDSTLLNKESYEKFFLSIVAIKNRDFVSMVLEVCHKRCTFYIEVQTSKPKIPSAQLASKIRHLRVTAPECNTYPQIGETILNPLYS